MDRCAVSLFLGSSGSNARGESSALEGCRVSSKSLSMGWDWDKGVAWRNVRVLTSLKRGHWFRQHRQVNDFLSKSKRNKLKNWVSEQTWSGVGSVETCQLSFPEEGGRGVGREELWSLAFLKKSIRGHIIQRYERPQTKMHTTSLAQF